MPVKNSLALDELQAHTGMFGPKTNDGYYELGLETAKIIRESVMLCRGVIEGPGEEDRDLPTASPSGTSNGPLGTPVSTETR
jgi:hypothetical protein